MTTEYSLRNKSNMTIKEIQDEITGLTKDQRSIIHFHWFEERTTKKKYQVYGTGWSGVTLREPDGKITSTSWNTFLIDFSKC